MGCGSTKSSHYVDDGRKKNNKEKDNVQRNQVEQKQQDYEEEEFKNDIEYQQQQQQQLKILTDIEQQQIQDIENKQQVYKNLTAYPVQGEMNVQNNYNKNNINEYIQNNNNKNNIDNVEIPQMKCQYHQKEEIKAININPNIKQKLCCFSCLQKNQYNPQDLINIQDIFDSLGNENFFQRWPKFQNNYYKSLAYYSLKDDDSVYEFFQQKQNNIKQKIIQYVEDYFEKINLNMRRFKDKKDQIKKQYQDCQYQEQLKKIIKHFENDALEKQISIILNKQATEQIKFEGIVQQQYEEMMNSLKQSHNQLELFKNNFNSFIKGQIFYSFNDLEQLKNYCKELNVILFDQPKLNIQSFINTENTFQVSYNNNTNINNSTSLTTTSNQEIKLLADKKNSTRGYLNIELKQNEQYEFKLQLKRQSKEYSILIGIQDIESTKQNKLFISNCVLSDSNKNTFPIQKIKNKLIYDDSELLSKDITLQICLQQKIFRWKYNDNVNQSLCNFNFNQNIPQYLYFVAGASSQIIVQSMKRVTAFEEW